MADPLLQVADRIHVGDERLVGRLVRVEVLVHIAVTEPLNAHVVEVVACCQLSPAFNKLPVP